MKKLLLLFILSFSVNLFSQEVEASQEPIENNIVYDKVDKQPEYPGGINAFRRNFSQTFNSSKINGKGQVKSEAIFVIGKDGYITAIEILGDNKSMNKEMERSIKTMSKTKWSPAEIKGHAVNYKFRLPITMNL